MFLTAAIEGLSDEGAATSMLREVGVEHYSIIGRSGKSTLLKKLAGYNSAAAYMPWFVLLDLDDDYPCAPAALKAWLGDQPASEHMCLRIAVAEMESWLLADVEAVASFLGVSRALIPPDPDRLSNPKELVVNLARRSNKRAIREGLVPRQGSGASVGPTYASDVSNFGLKSWRPAIARERSESLDRALRALEQLVQRQ